MIGLPRVHHRTTDSTNARARELATAGAPHGTLVTAGEQTSGRGRQGRSWATPANTAIAASLVLTEFDDLLPLRAGLAVADVAGPRALVKWPNDVWVDGKKVAGILAESRSEPRWAVLGIGLNVAVDVEQLPDEAKAVAGTLGKTPADIEPTLQALLEALERRLAQDREAALDDLRRKDALRGEPVKWQDGEGIGAGIDDTGALLVTLPNGGQTTLAAGEVTLSARA
jgi:BirA family biotin operon repressor/biotin-[acetyl-CoA-carboxylase] ligase